MSLVDRDHVLRLYEYHHWAEDRMLDAFGSVTTEQLDKPWGGSFGTGRGLLRHVVGADRLWVERWNGRSPKSLPDFPATHAGRDFRAEWEKVKADERLFLSSLAKDRLTSELTYVNMKGEQWTYPFAEILVHVVNHGTYHRGQLTHLLRDLGQAPTSTDYLVFLQEQRKR